MKRGHPDSGGVMPTWIVVVTLIATPVALILLNRLWDAVARWYQLPRAPSFRSLAGTVELEGINPISSDGWRHICKTRADPPSFSFISDCFRIFCWRRPQDGEHVQWVFIVAEDGKKYAWHLSFLDGEFLQASIGGSGARLRTKDLTLEDLRYLTTFHYCIAHYLREEVRLSA